MDGEDNPIEQSPDNVAMDEDQEQQMDGGLSH